MMQGGREVIRPAKRSDAMERWDEWDRLSNLPKELLVHIFSFLDTKQAVQSCVLSKQWVKFWTLLPDLDFDSDNFEKFSSYEEFVNMVLTHRDSSVMIRCIKFSENRYDIDTHSIYSPSRLELSDRMVKYAVSHNVQHIEVSGWYSKLPYSCDSLRTMKLKRVQLEHSLCFKQLVSLYISHVNLRNYEIFSGCPNLEQFTLRECLLDEEFLIIAPQLSRLCIDMFWSRANKIVLSTPRLTFMKFRLHVPCVSRTNELPFLEAIDIELDDSYDLKEKLNVISVLKCFFNVKRMRLSYRVIQILSELLNISAQEPSLFCNMEVLNIISPWCCKSVTIPVHVMMYLLGNSPHAKIVVEEKR